jgi:hypothetical protein
MEDGRSIAERFEGRERVKDKCGGLSTALRSGRDDVSVGLIAMGLRIERA